MQRIMSRSIAAKPSLRPARLRASFSSSPRTPRFVSPVSCAAASGDPYDVLGLPQNADYNAIQRAYKKKLSENRGNEEVQAAIEAAHSSLMMNALTSRLQGGAPVDKNVLYADRARYFPWRPKLWLAEQKVIMYSAIAQCVLLAWALLSPLTAGTQPVIWSATAGAVGNIYKQNRISPPPVRGMEVSDEEKKQGGKNIMRGAFLAFMATFSGCLLFYTAPDAIAAQVNRVLPIWFYEGQTVLLTLGTTLMNLLFTSIYR
mmetsp:Transcript_3798/g.10852  ORF Transcript_3798/g.10852 Transcript_3798/m.10852 type:complete len:259 (-) Transcript_3798:732-1508(-)